MDVSGKMNVSANREPVELSPKKMKQKHCQEQFGTTNDSKTEELISKQAASALLYLFFYSILMFTLPFGAFFGTGYILREHTELSDFATTSLSVTSSVITIYIIIACYAIKGYNEKDVIPNERKIQRNKID